MPLINKKITECTELTTAPAADDVYPLVDISDTTDDPTGTSKRQTWLNLIKFVFGSRFAADAGANDTYVATLVPAPAAYETGQHYRFKANTANTGACTVNFNALGAKAIKKAAGGITTDLADNDIRAGQWVDVVYDGTNMQMQSLLGNVSAGGVPAAHAASHENGGGDEVSVAGLSGVLADPQVADKIKESSGPTTLTVGAVSDGQFLKRSGTDVIGAALAAADIPANLKTKTVIFIFDGGGSVIATGIHGDIPIHFNGTVQSAELYADQSGSIVIDVWKDVKANFPPTDADSITASAPPTLSSDDFSEDSTLTGWTTALSAGDVLRFNVDSVTTIQRATLALKVLAT